MGKAFEPPIPGSIQRFLLDQHIFFVATAPLESTGKVNISPKTVTEFRVLDDKTVCYVELMGSGSETSSHILQPNNGRVCFMFCAFSGAPKIIRLHGKGQLILLDDLIENNLEPIENNKNIHVNGKEVHVKDNVNLTKDERNILFQKIRKAYDFPKDISALEVRKKFLGFRSFVVLHCDRYSHSCGFGVSKYEYVGERKTLDEFNKKANPDMSEYQCVNNSYSIDGLDSVGLLLTDQKPAGKKVVDGFIHAQFGEPIATIDNPNPKKIEGELKVSHLIEVLKTNPDILKQELSMVWQDKGIKKRDLVFGVIGALVAFLLLRRRKSLVV